MYPDNSFCKSFIAFCRISSFLLILSLNVQAQEGVQKRFFTSQNGLKISWVNSITKSQNNTFTIVHGPMIDLSIYDGYNFDYTISREGILGKTYEDFSGNLWSIDEGNLDNVFFNSDDNWQNLEFEGGIPFMPTPDIGNKLLFIRDGDLKEFDKIKQQTRIIKRAEESSIGQFIDMTTSQDGSVWITGEEGVAKCLVQCDTCNFLEQWIDFQVPKSLGLYHFNKPFEGEDGELTLMSKSSKTKHNVLVGFNGKLWQELYTSKNEEVIYGWRGPNNSFWIIKGMQSPPPLNNIIKNWNLFYIQQGKEIAIVKNRVLDRVLNDVIVEPNGDFWIATGSGLAYFTPTLWRRVGTNTDLKQRFKKIHEDLNGRLWFAAEDSFFLWLNGKWELLHFNPLVFTGDICSLIDGLLIVGISEKGGLALFNPVDKSCTVSFPFGNEKVRYYSQDKNGNCFIILQNLNGTSRLIRYNGKHIEELAVDLKIDGLTPGACEVTDIIQAQNKDIWIVTYTDVIVYKKGIKKSFDLKKEFEWGLSTSILELENGNIWIGGGKGIIQYNGKHWSFVQSPEFETVRKMIISRDSIIWVASGTGIHRLINGTWVSNSVDEGLPNTTIFDVFEDKQGRILAAGLNGAYSYYPEADTSAPETVIPSDKNSQEATPTGDLQFVFEGRDKWDYTPVDKLQYSYRFDENPWTPFEKTTVVMGVGLSSGPHVFEVRAMDLNGNIDQSPASWSFTVMLPWYLETYFIILLIITLLIIFLLIRFAVTRHRQVEKLVVIRTAELEKTKEKAEESDRLKSAFLANMSHEIRTPMNGILGFAELLKTPNLTGDQQQKYISIIEKGGARMLNIINNIVNISKIEAGQENINMQNTNISEQIETIYNFFKPEVESKGIQFLCKNSLRLENSIIITDYDKVYSAISNIVKNAIKYSHKGSIELGCSKKDDFLEFYVADTGIGIPKDRQEAIFKRFIQADIADKNVYEGWGLGLSISKAYIEMLGGKIWVESKEGIGSTFFFTLPYVTKTIKEKPIKEEVPTSHNEAPTTKLKILIAEDEEVSAEYLTTIVREFGKDIINVQNGEDAVKACKNNQDIDLVLMDIRMPLMDGCEATRQIRKFNKEVIIIAQTAYALSGDRKKAIEAGCNDYITKPIEKEKFIKKIQKIFGNIAFMY